MIIKLFLLYAVYYSIYNNSDNFSQKIKPSNSLKIITLICILLYLVLDITKSEFIFILLAASYDITDLLKYPITIITHSLTHHKFNHIFSNLLMLSIISKSVIDNIKNKNVIKIYFISSAVSVIVMKFINLSVIQGDGIIYGASASVSGLLGAIFIKNKHDYANLWFFKTKIKYFFIFDIFLNIILLELELTEKTLPCILHLTGHITGVLLMYLNEKNYGSNTERTHKKQC